MHRLFEVSDGYRTDQNSAGLSACSRGDRGIDDCAAQFAGALAASWVVYLTYSDALYEFDGGVRQVVGPQATAGIWATYPQTFLPPLPGGLKYTVPVG